MTTVDNWPVEISLHAEEGKTQAVVRLAKDGVSMTGHGLACVTPMTRKSRRSGEIVAARALSDLAHQLLSDAAGQIEDITHQRAHPSL